MEKFGYAYAIAVTAGGVMGYARKGSAASLAMGVLFGTLSAVGSYQLGQNPKNYWLLLGTCGTLGVVMGMRAFRSGKFMPAGMVASLSGAMTVGLLPKLFQ